MPIIAGELHNFYLFGSAPAINLGWSHHGRDGQIPFQVPADPFGCQGSPLQLAAVRPGHGALEHVPGLCALLRPPVAGWNGPGISGDLCWWLLLVMTDFFLDVVSLIFFRLLVLGGSYSSSWVSHSFLWWSRGLGCWCERNLALGCRDTPTTCEGYHDLAAILEDIFLQNDQDGKPIHPRFGISLSQHRATCHFFVFLFIGRGIGWSRMTICTSSPMSSHLEPLGSEYPAAWHCVAAQHQPIARVPSHLEKTDPGWIIVGWCSSFVELGLFSAWLCHPAILIFGGGSSLLSSGFVWSSHLRRDSSVLGTSFVFTFRKEIS